jgi:predicted enzyme related to lactoylglutathione lyase
MGSPELAYVLIAVSNIERAKRFYQDVIGLTATAEVPGESAQNTGSILGIDVADLVNLLALVVAAGGGVGERRTMPNGRSGATVYDPDGNTLELVEQTSPPYPYSPQNGPGTPAL